MSAEGFKQFSGPTAPLLRMKKRLFLNSELFTGDVEIHHFGEHDLDKVKPVWSITTDTGMVVAEGHFPKVNIARGGRTQLGRISADLGSVSSAEKLRVTVSIKQHKITNGWDIWVYPDSQATVPSEIKTATAYNDDVKQALAAGQSVLLIADEDDLQSSIPGQFKPVFWSPSWWWTKPRGGDVSMSILTDPNHAIFSTFPTDTHSNWQWWDLLEGSRSMVLDAVPLDIHPIVQIVDNFSRNHKLANMIELRVGKGKLLITSMDLASDLDTRMAAQQMRKSVLHYMESSDFLPAISASDEQLVFLLK